MSQGRIEFVVKYTYTEEKKLSQEHRSGVRILFNFWDDELCINITLFFA